MLLSIVSLSLFEDFVCPRCDSGFIEEVAEDSRYGFLWLSKTEHGKGIFNLSNLKVIRSEACMTFSFNATDRFSLLCSLLQTSTASVASDDSNSLLSEVCPNKCHLYKNVTLSFWRWHIASLVSLQVMAAALYGALRSAVASALLRVRPWWQRAGFCWSEPSSPSITRPFWGRRTRVSFQHRAGEAIEDLWAKACSGRVSEHGIQKYSKGFLSLLWKQPKEKWKPLLYVIIVELRLVLRQY